MSQTISVSEFAERLPESAQIDDIYDVLSSNRRRQVLRCLDGNDGPTAIADLARDVAREEAPDGEEPELAAVERVQVSLYHADLPKMAEAGLVEVARDRRTTRFSRTGAALAVELRPGEDS